MKKFIRKLLGIDKLLIEKEQAMAEVAKAKSAEELAKLSPKQRATARGEPWVAVLETHINKENIRNGFFELDWNSEFIVQLKQAGYGLEGDPEEEIVDRWFRDLAGNMLAEAGVVDPSKTVGGFLNVHRLGTGLAEIK